MAILFNKKIEKGMEIMRERNRIYLEDYEQKETEGEQQYAFRNSASDEYIPEKDEAEFEKGDILAIIIAAFSVFWPVFLVLGIILFFAFRYLLNH